MIDHLNTVCKSCKRGYLVLAKGLSPTDKPGGEDNCYCPHCGKVASRYPRDTAYGEDYKVWTAADA